MDPYEEEYLRQLEEYSRIAGEDGSGDIDLTMGSADDAFASEYQRNGSASNDSKYTAPVQQERGGYEGSRYPRDTAPGQRSSEQGYRPERGSGEKRPQRYPAPEGRRRPQRSGNSAPERTRERREERPAPRTPQKPKDLHRVPLKDQKSARFIMAAKSFILADAAKAGYPHMKNDTLYAAFSER